MGLAAAFVVVVVALARPVAIAPLNRLWTRFGLALNRVTQPVIMALLFYGAVTPTALIMRALGEDPLERRFDANATTYWVEPESPDPKPMRNQFKTSTRCRSLANFGPICGFARSSDRCRY